MTSDPRAPKDATRLLNRLGEGDPSAAEELMPYLYEELRDLARSHMASERGGHTLQPTALIHEAYLHLVQDAEGADGNRFASRRHFFGLASRVMRSLLVDHARRRRAAKRGGDRARLTISGVPREDGAADELDVLELHEALERLSAIDEHLGQIVELRFFGGLTAAETSNVLEMPLRTVERRWRAASAWLRAQLA